MICLCFQIKILLFSAENLEYNSLEIINYFCSIFLPFSDNLFWNSDTLAKILTVIASILTQLISRVEFYNDFLFNIRERANTINSNKGVNFKL